ncbi:hypothetical protein VZT92_024710 [Zoarces viviparus]|uniref:Peptidase A1 domain-containing protein n=1 Tax=Zoarces viviparus TaxID=48416 RepID=A0AAW1E2J0_ZOAVI
MPTYLLSPYPEKDSRAACSLSEEWTTAWTRARSTGPLTSDTYWHIGVDGFQINGQETGWCSQGCQSIVDTGTSMLTAPSQLMGSIMQAIGAQQSQYGQYMVDCSQINNLPTLSFVISGVSFPLPPSAYIIQHYLNGYQFCSVGITPTYLPSRDVFFPLIKFHSLPLYWGGGRNLS